MKSIIASCIFIAISICSQAQLKGSGKTVIKTFDITNFDKLQLQDLDGDIQVLVGPSFSVSVEIDDNLEQLLHVQKNPDNNELVVKLEKNESNRMYIENTGIKVKITMPAVKAITHIGNSNLYVNGISPTFRLLKKSGNGNVNAMGNCESLTVQNSGNGNVDMSKLYTKTAIVTCTGNGDVLLNASGTVEANVSGNGNIENRGAGVFTKNSKKSGNGELIVKPISAQ